MSARVRVVSFVSLFFIALAMYPYINHLLAMPGKLGMSEQEYFIAQQSNVAWPYSGTLVFLAFVSTIILSIQARENSRVFRFALGAVFCIGISLVVFFMFAWPASQVTNDWTVASPYWEILRIQWEYSQAFNALLYIFAEILIVFSLISWHVKEEFHRHAV
jgi:hypothetical protein